MAPAFGMTNSSAGMLCIGVLRKGSWKKMSSFNFFTTDNLQNLNAYHSKHKFFIKYCPTIHADALILSKITKLISSLITSLLVISGWIGCECVWKWCNLWYPTIWTLFGWRKKLYSSVHHFRCPWHRLTVIQTNRWSHAQWISYPFSNFNCTIEVWEWIK